MSDAQKKDGLTKTQAYQFTNRFSARAAKKHDLGGEVLDRSKKIAKATYDFSVSGGAVGDVTLQADAIPANAVITNVWSDEQTALTSGGSATVVIRAGSTDLTGSLAFDSAFTGADSHALASSAEAIKISTQSDLIWEIEAEALTAGKVVVAVEYWVTN